MKRGLHFVTIGLVLSGLGVVGACTSNDDSTPVVIDDEPTCDPACDVDGCQICRVEAGVAQCVSACGPGLACESGQCMAPGQTSCEPGCGPCQACDISGSEPVCVDVCADGTECRAGACVPTDTQVATACEPACGACETCDVSGADPVCVAKCDADEACTDEGVCVRAASHAQFTGLAGPFATGPDVTAACVECHQDEAEAFMATPHWNWTGPTPNLQGHEGSTEIGKRNLVNNFCVAVPSNEKRCSQCHAGYDYDSPDFSFNDITKVDCLVCHADPASGYKKAKTTAGGPVDGVDLTLAAQSVGVSNRSNCGHCHFSPGGGDNVKSGDLGSALRSPSVTTDVHMGRGMTCADCHAGDGHDILGQGVHVPVSVGRLSCADCHGETPHTSMPIYDEHAIDVACQTCHIPAFSRSQPTKTWWNWRSAGDKSRGNGGIEMGTLEDGTPVQTYNWMKGDFRWGKNVKPTFAWFDGGVQHMTLESTYEAGLGTEENPIIIANPTADILSPEAKIFPFKVMRGTQPAHLTERFLIAPKLFGPGGFWPQVPAAQAYTPEAVRELWTTTLTTGARTSGQIAETSSIADGDWGFVYTEMYLGINHEVAPADMALGSDEPLTCVACHGNDDFPWTELGYACDPLVGGGEACGSRH